MRVLAGWHSVLSPCKRQADGPVEGVRRLGCLYENFLALEAWNLRSYGGCLPSLFRHPRPTRQVDEHLAPNTQLSVLEQSQPIEFVIVIKSDDEAKLVELEEQVASLQRKAADSLRCKVAKQLRTQLAEARAEVEAHEAQRFENCAIQQQQVETLNISLVVASKQLTRAKANHAKLSRRSSLRRSSLVIASRRLEQQQQQLDQAHAALSKTRP